MQTFIQIIEKIKKIKGLKFDYEVANLLGISEKAFSADKKRNSIPLEELSTFCSLENIFLDELLTGKKMSVYKEPQETCSNIIKEASEDYPEIKISEALRMCSAVLESKTSYAIALYHNLVHFDRAVKSENLYNQCHDDLIAVNKTLSEMRTRMDGMEEDNKKLKDEIKLLLDHSGGSAPIKLTMDHAAPTGTEDKET